MIRSFFHSGGAEGGLALHGAGGAGVGNPLYDTLSGHEIALVAVLALPLLAWWLHIRASDRSARAVRLLAGYRALTPVDHLAVWSMAASAAVHLALAPGHGGGIMAILFVTQAALLGLIMWRALTGRRWRAPGAAVLGGSVVAYAVAVFGGDVPDQVGLATKLVELVGLAAILRASTDGHRVRRTAGWGIVTVLALATSVSGWFGAIAAAGGTADHAIERVDDQSADGAGDQAGDGSGDHATIWPAPGSVMRMADAGEASPDEVRVATDLHERLVAATARYADPAIAAADGYEVDGMYGTDFHAVNQAYEEDGRIMDPERPENLIYAITPRGPVLLGAMFTVPVGVSGPALGGPLTVWHAHEHVCIGLLPPGLSGLLSPLGGCPAGSVDVPITNEMIHAWVAPGAPQEWGDLDETWRDAYLARQATTP